MKKQLILLSIFLVVVFFAASPFLCGADKEEDTKSTNKNKNQFVKFVVKIKVPGDFFGSEFEVDYKVGYGKEQVDHFIDRNIIVFNTKSETQKKEENIIEASKLDYSKYLRVEYMVKVSHGNEYVGKIVCGGFNAFQLFPSQPISKIIINIYFNVEKSAFICMTDYKPANDKSN